VATWWSVHAEVEAEELARAEEARREQEARAQQATRLESLGVMAGGIAHDFNNLLVGVLGNAELALMGVPDESRARQHIERVLLAAQRAISSACGPPIGDSRPSMSPLRHEW
jgi:signal transduction histidine kinase